jgi:hypothetical protein
MFPPLLFGFAALFLQMVMACGGPSPHVSGVEWKGEPLRVGVRFERPDADALSAEGLHALRRQPPVRMLNIVPGEWGDSLKLLEFDDDVQAYTAFQELAGQPDDIAMGISVYGDRVCFRRGRWIGILDAWSWKGEGWFDKALELPGSATLGELPAAFGSMPHRGRIPGSERILTSEFMGQNSTVPVFALKLDCRGDTAWFYAAPELRPTFADSLVRLQRWHADTLKNGLQVSSDFFELAPTRLLFLRGGMAGVEGCFDENLTKEWLKIQFMALRSLK